MGELPHQRGQENIMHRAFRCVSFRTRPTDGISSQYEAR